MRKEKIEVIITASEYIDRLIFGIENTCEKIYSGEEMMGISLLPQIIDGIEYILKVIELTKDVLGESIDEKRILPYLNEIIEGMENEDYTLVADVYTYEVVPILKEIKSIFTKIIKN